MQKSSAGIPKMIFSQCFFRGFTEEKIQLMLSKLHSLCPEEYFDRKNTFRGKVKLHIKLDVVETW